MILFLAYDVQYFCFNYNYVFLGPEAWQVLICLKESLPD